MHRRHFLGASATFVGLIAGCFGEQPDPAPSGTAQPGPTAAPTPGTTTEPSTESDGPDRPTPSEPVHPRGDPVAVERTITDRPGYADDIEYFPSNGTVRHVTVRSGDRPAGFDTRSFEEWGRGETAKAGLDRVREATAVRLGTDGFGSAVGRAPADAGTDTLVIWVQVATTYDRDGEVRSTPTVPFERLVATAPRAVDTTVTLESDTFSRTVPVFARSVVRQLH